MKSNERAVEDELPGGKPPDSAGTADRLAEPVDQEQPPRLPFAVVGIGASAGGLEACIDFFKATPANPGMAFVVVQHLPPDRESLIAEILSKHTTMPVLQVEDGIAVEINHVYVIRPANTMKIHEGHLHLSEPVEERGHRRPVDDFFRSLAEEQRERAIGVILSGMGSNGSTGAQSIKAVGGVCIAQDPSSAKFPMMPRHLIDAGLADFILRPQDMPEALVRYAKHPYATSRPDAEALLQGERQVYADILTMLRTRSRQDFTGYKKPTVLRRIQRRMGLHQIETLSQYARMLRQNPTESLTLADDLVIHVTGFFRDPDAWQSLSEQVIAPMVAERETGTAIRAWVTACASGEEAYSLGILLTEAAEAAGKTFDVKIFATDLTDRVLSHARNGVYPMGIESEITPERLDRFFDKDDSTFRIKPVLREMVVFAPQNLLQDPPFSRLDFCTCRNLLIYLQPDVQRRVLGLLHFGLREGGTLFLGNSETVSGCEELFETIDKKWRIFRRVGPTRQGTVNFPLNVNTGDIERGLGRMIPRASIAHMTQRVLIERFTPAAVVVDRQQRAVYFHGDTSPFLVQPPGEPTRELLVMAREDIRGSLRIALHRCLTENTSTTVPDGFIDSPEGRVRIAVTVAPLESKTVSDYFIVSFERIPYVLPPATAHNGDKHHETETEPPAVEQLQRVRSELERTVEELQTSNEELKASNEEVTSVNEELQSTNEELETSKEELQSLNEELSTVNAQLQTKMEELETATSDLSSLLSSTDIAVVFLDTQFRIRRYTPALLDLIELIPSDVGRPLQDLAQKFSDPDLMADARKVLERLIPIERQIASEGKRWYMRRILPYRTMDNHIEGVVITFVDITRRHVAEIAQRESEERYRLIVEGATEYAIIMLDDHGRIATWNTGAEHVLGYSPKEVLGDSIGVIFTIEDQLAGMPEKEIKTARETGRAVDERWHVRKDGRQIWASGWLTSLTDDTGQLRGYAKIMRDNTDRKLAEERVHQARRAAELANDAKDQFLATVSHELRTPLSVILLWSKMINAGSLSAEEIKDANASIERSAEAQKQLIEDLLDTSRISSGKLRLNLKPTDLRALVDMAVSSIRPAAETKGIKILTDADPTANVGTVLIDPDRMQQIAWNLLSNAVKFTPGDGLITVELQRLSDQVELRVTDNGRGFEPGFAATMFERFTQAENPQTRAQGGLGLGLAITKQLVTLHGGTIEAQSTGVNLGATFTVRLPCPVITPTQTAAAEAAILPTAANRIRGLHMLLVEDNPDSGTALAKLLGGLGANVKLVQSAAVALDAFKAAKFDLIVSDVGMPDMNGYTFIQQIRKLELARPGMPVPAIALSAFTRDQDRQQAMASGFQTHVAKPVEINALMQAMLALLPPMD